MQFIGAVGGLWGCWWLSGPAGAVGGRWGPLGAIGGHCGPFGAVCVVWAVGSSGAN